MQGRIVIDLTGDDSDDEDIHVRREPGQSFEPVWIDLTGDVSEEEAEFPALRPASPPVSAILVVNELAGVSSMLGGLHLEAHYTPYRR